MHARPIKSLVPDLGAIYQGMPEDKFRLIVGIGKAVAEKGYSAATIADVVRHAGVSKRTFYEQFEDKNACFLESYRMASRLVLDAIEAAAHPALPWDARIDAATRAYFESLDSAPELTQTFLLEISAAGPEALSARREVHREFATLLRKLVATERKANAAIRPLSPMMAAAIVGGINELVLVALEEHAPLRSLAQTASELLRAVLQAPRR